MHKVPILIFLSLKLILTTGFDVSAQTIFVDQSATGANNGTSWSDAFTDLQQAISVAQAGDEVWLAAGHYYPTSCNSCSEADRSISFELPDGVAFYGGFVGTETLREQRDWQNNLTYLDGDINDDHSSFLNSYTIVYTEGVSAATIVDGLHLINGNANDLSSLGSLKASGAAWFNQSPSSTEPSSPTIRNCTFADNKANGFGGGFCNSADFSGKASPYFEQVTFIDNQAKEGAGLFNDGSHQGQCTPTLRNCLFINNDATQFGGGMSNDGGYSGRCSPIIIDCVFRNNTCDSGGGAISNRAYQNGISNPYIAGTLFEDNHSGAIGGAILNFGIEGTASPTLERCEFSRNFASTYGGSIYNHGKTGNSSPKISNCLFYKNEAYSCAGMYNLGSNNGNASPEVTNCTFYGNIAKYGTCIYNNAGSSSDGISSPIIANCIFWGNIATQIADAHIFRNVSGTPTISHSLVDASSCEALNSGTGTNTVTCTGGMIFNQAPHFVDTVNADFRLLANSPAIDAGDNTMMIEDLDLDDHLRIFNGLVDLGAFEYGSMPYEVPSFTMQPSATTACENGNTTFMVTVVGTTPVQYQWFKNNTIVAGADQMSLSLNGLTAMDEAAYTCRVISVLADTITSSPAALTVVPNLAVSIMINASATEICVGETINFTAITTNGGTNPSFIWEVNNVDQNVDSSSFSSAALSDGDEVRCSLSSSETCTTNATAISNLQVITVNPVLTADIAITSSTTEICAGEVLSFAATTTNGGTNPSYEWRLNGTMVGSNNDTLVLANLSDGDELTCQLTSAETCVLNPIVVSDPLTITVNPILNASVSLTATATEICAGETVLFTATTTNGGTNPTYAWQLNGMLIGTNSDTLSISNLSDGDELTCQLSSSESCIATTTVVSDPIVITVNPVLTASLAIAASAIEICAGEVVFFTATATNAGTNPIYEWRLNGGVVGANHDTLSLTSLSNGDEIICQLASSEPCTGNALTSSNPLIITVNPVLSVGVAITATATEICAGEVIEFMATATNAGINPSYEWRLNGVAIGTNNSTLSISTLSDNDEITCQLTSSASCIVNAIAMSNIVSITVNPILEVAVSIAATATETCAGELVTLTATATNGGLNPTYQWFLNGSLLTETSEALVVDNLMDGDSVYCILNSTINCTSNAVATSNVLHFTVNDLLLAELNLTASDTNICAGSTVSFFAEAIQGGTNPSYQWTLNGVVLMEENDTLVLPNLLDGDEIQCQLTSSKSCVVEQEVWSNPLSITVAPLQDVTLSIDASASDICAGTMVQFVAMGDHVGESPIYTWYLNGEVVANNSDVFETDNLNNGDKLSCTLLSSESCTINPFVTSDTITMEVSPQLDLEVVIEASVTTFCEGESVDFSTDVINSGDNFNLMWHINGASIGVSTEDFSSELFNDGDRVSCVIESTATCLNQSIDTSNVITVTVLPNLIPNLEIETQQTEICLGDTVLFESTFAHSGENPSFQWYVNGTAITGGNTQTFSTDFLADEDEVSCTLISSETCLAVDQVQSNFLVLDVKDCTVGLNTVAHYQALKTYPNPSQGIVNIEMPSRVTTVDVYVVDTKGAIVYEEFGLVPNPAKSLQLDLTRLSSGLYFLKLVTPTQSFSESLFLNNK